MADDELSLIFTALADPTRRGILARLAQGDATVSELAAPYNLSLPAISKHLKVLRKAGLVSQGRNGQWRPCHLEAKPLEQVAEWTERYRRIWGESFNRLDALLTTLQNKEKDHDRIE